MSGRSPTTRQLITAGLVGVGVGVLAAGVTYAISTSPTNCSPQPSERRCRLEDSCDRKTTKKNFHVIPYHECDQCKICGKDMSSEPSVSLTCNHSFHRKCLFSSYVVQTQVNKGSSFKCPFDACQVEISENILESLMALH